MRWFIKFLAVGFCFLFILSELLFGSQLEYGKVYRLKDGMNADEIMQIKYHNKYSLFAQDYSSTSRIIYVDPSGFKRSKEAVRKRIVKAGKEGVQYKDIIYLTYPSREKGLAILTWTYEDPQRDQDTWLWIPALKKVRKISASEADDSFMGSDLTVEEVSTRRFEDESYRLLGEKVFEGYKVLETGEEKHKGTSCYIIECIPKRPHWYYSKRVILIDKNTGGNIFEQYYDKKGEIFKTIFRNWIWYDVGGGKQYPIQDIVECKDLRTGHYSTVFVENSLYDKGIDEQEFTVRQLERSKW